MSMQKTDGMCQYEGKMHCNVNSNKQEENSKTEEENRIKIRRKGLNEYAEN